MYFSKYSCQLGNISEIFFYKFRELTPPPPHPRENTAPKHYFQMFTKAVSTRYIQYSCKTINLQNLGVYFELIVTVKTFISGANYRWQSAEKVIPIFRPILEDKATSTHFHFPP